MLFRSLRVDVLGCGLAPGTVATHLSPSQSETRIATTDMSEHRAGKTDRPGRPLDDPVADTWPPARPYVTTARNAADECVRWRGENPGALVLHRGIRPQTACSYRAFGSCSRNRSNSSALLLIMRALTPARPIRGKAAIILCRSTKNNAPEVKMAAATILNHVRTRNLCALV